MSAFEVISHVSPRILLASATPPRTRIADVDSPDLVAARSNRSSSCGSSRTVLRGESAWRARSRSRAFGRPGPRFDTRDFRRLAAISPNTLAYSCRTEKRQVRLDGNMCLTYIGSMMAAQVTHPELIADLEAPKVGLPIRRKHGTSKLGGGFAWRCQECGHTFRGTRGVEKAMSTGCPKCGGVDIDCSRPVK